MLTNWFKPKPAPKTKIGPEIIDKGAYCLTLRLNARAKRISLRLDAAGRGAILTFGRKSHRLEALRFAESRHDWIMERLQTSAVGPKLKVGESLPFLGRTLLLQARDKTIAARIEGDQLISSGDEATFRRRILKALKTEALKYAREKVQSYAHTLGYAGVVTSLIDAKSRWGSCTPSRKTIRLNWRLIFASPEVFDYVCAHEAAHLLHPDHSPAFWATVERLYGAYKPARAWLKAEGNGLHAII